MKVISELTLEQMAKRIGKLKPGDSFHVQTYKERAHALTAARVLRKKVITRANYDGGGFTVAAIP